MSWELVYEAFPLILGVVLIGGSTCYLVMQMDNDKREIAKQISDLMDGELHPLQQQVKELAATLGDYPDLCRRVERLMAIYQEVRAKAELYENPLEMVARKREP